MPLPIDDGLDCYNRGWIFWKNRFFGVTGMGVAVPKSRTSELAHAGRQALWLALLLALTAGAQNGPPNMQQ